MNLFTDIGTVFGNKVDPIYSNESIRASYGFGIKFYSPIGPIGFSWGFPLLSESHDIKKNPNAAMCFHWKSIRRQIIISGIITQVSDKEADLYFNSRSYESRIGAWASDQSNTMKERTELLKKIKYFKKKYSDEKSVPRPKHWSGWCLKPKSIEFWLDGENRIHERLKYSKTSSGWKKEILYP